MPKKLKKRVSQRDIARILGINVSTVSRALNGLEGVSPALQEMWHPFESLKFINKKVHELTFSTKSGQIINYI